MARLQIVVGVLKKQDQVLLSLRQKHQAYADFWEFPGGKVEPGESFEQALQREFEEEVGVRTGNWQPLITIPWDYEHASVTLNVFVSEDFDGKPVGMEGQKIEWVFTKLLKQYRFPEANQGIVGALCLPHEYMISGGFHDVKDGLNRLETALKEGVRLVQLRAKNLEEEVFLNFAEPAVTLVHQYHGKVLINGKPEWLEKLPEADGLQLASTAIMQWTERPIAEDKLLSVSTHNEVEIAKALELKADLILLSPVKETSSHPGVSGLGWNKFCEMVAQVPVPVYALGGMKASDVKEARKNGAQGVAAISSYWPQPI